MESKTAEEILKKHCLIATNGMEYEHNVTGKAILNAMEEYASIKLAEKDKEIERLLNALVELKKDIEADGYNFRLGTMDKVNTAILKSLNK